MTILPEVSSAPPSLSALDDVHAFWAERWAGPKLGWHKEDVNPHLAKYTNLLLDIDSNGSESRGKTTNNNNANVEKEEEEGGARIFVPLCGKSVDLAYLTSHPQISHVVGIDIVRNAAEDFASDHQFEFSMEEVVVQAPQQQQLQQQQHDNECKVVDTEGDEEECCENNAYLLQQPTTMTNYHDGKGLTILIGDLFDFLSLNNTDRVNCMVTKGTYSSSTTSSSSSSSYSGILPVEYLFDTIYDRASMVAIKPTLRNDYVTLMGELLRPGGVILLVSLDRRKTTSVAAKEDGPPFSMDEGEVRRLYESQEWVESVTLLEEVNDLNTDKDRERWEKKGVLELYEIVFLIRKKR